MFMICNNGDCPRAGWCKRFTYRSKDKSTPYPSYNLNECPRENYTFYVKNKAREIYERENPNDTFDQSSNNEEPVQREHSNNNRESRMREDDEIDHGIEEHLRDWGGATDPDLIRELFSSGDSGSNDQDNQSNTEYTIDMQSGESITEPWSYLLSHDALAFMPPPRTTASGFAQYVAPERILRFNEYRDLRGLSWESRIEIQQD